MSSAGWQFIIQFKSMHIVMNGASQLFQKEYFQYLLVPITQFGDVHRVSEFKNAKVFQFFF